MDGHGWVVLPTATNTWVAGAGQLLEVNNDEARSVATGEWDYDFVQLAAAEDGSILIASGRTLWHFDPRSGTFLDRFDLGELGYLDAVLSTDSGTWVAASGGAANVLARIDLDSGKVLQRFPIGQGLHQLAEGGGYLLVASRSSDGAVVRVDPETGEVANVPAPEGSIGVIGTKVWVAWGNGVSCTDAVSLTPCGEVPVERATSLASDGIALWVLSSTGSKDPSTYLPDPDQPATVTMLDGHTGQVLAGPLALNGYTPSTIAARAGSAWIAFHDTGRIIRIDPCEQGRCAA
jgi:streptogramin lyase